MTNEIQPKTVLAYIDERGKEPFTEWLESLKERKTVERIRVRLRRLESGLYGDCQSVGEGVSELRLFFGAGYRIYFGEDEGNIVILLCGGDKSSQSQDIKVAKIYWKDYQDNG
jgi:putative addiction module killer protein